jgi:hypothetical protein
LMAGKWQVKSLVVPSPDRVRRLCVRFRQS